MRLLLTAGVLFVVAATAALAQTAPPIAPAPTASPPASPSPSPSPAPSAAVTVHIRNFAYVPATVTIHAGEAVRFVQDDDSAHTVTATDASYDSGDLPKGASWTHVFAKAGTSKYLCDYHRFMTGSVVVTQ